MSTSSSFQWVAVAQGARVLAQLASVAVIARILPTQAYGLMAMAMAVTNLIYLCRDLGTSAAIIQRRRMGRRMLSSVHWVNVVVALAIAVLLVGLAGPIARAFDEPRLQNVLIVLALVFPVSGMSLVHQALLERASRFAVLARIEIVSSLVGMGAAIALALLGAGVWSLVMHMLIATVLTTAQLLMVSGFRAGWMFSAKRLRSIVKLGADLSLFRLIIYLEQNVDSIVIGKFLGSAALGSYTLAYKIMIFPLQNLTSIVSRSLFPLLSRNQAEPAVLANIYLRTLSATCLLTAPMMAGVFFLREEFVLLLFGPNWPQVSGVLRYLAAVGFLQSLTAGTGVVFMALGKSRLMLRLGLVGGVLHVGSFLVGVGWGIEGVAGCYLLATALNLLPCFYFTAAVLHIGPRSVLDTVARPVLAACLMLMAMAAAAHFLQAAWPPGVYFVANIALGAAAYLLAVRYVVKVDLSDLLRLLKIRRHGSGGGVKPATTDLKKQASPL